LVKYSNRKKNYFVFSGDKILDALKRINDNLFRIIFVVEEIEIFEQPRP